MTAHFGCGEIIVVPRPRVTRRRIVISQAPVRTVFSARVRAASVAVEARCRRRNPRCFRDDFSSAQIAGRRRQDGPRSAAREGGEPSWEARASRRRPLLSSTCSCCRRRMRISTSLLIPTEDSSRTRAMSAVAVALVGGSRGSMFSILRLRSTSRSLKETSTRRRR